jgi:hypothetical protein
MIDPKVVKDIKNLLKSKEDNGWRCRSYGKYPIVVLIGESHNITNDELELQNTLIGWVEPGYILSERLASHVKSQISSVYNNIAENACFFGNIECDEEKQGNIVENCSEVSSKPIVAILGAWHVRKDSRIHENFHENLNEHNSYICIWNERDIEKKRREKENEGVEIHLTAL